LSVLAVQSEVKICSRCSREKSLIDFREVPSRKDGYDCWCRECRIEYCQSWNASHREKQIQMKRAAYRDSSTGVRDRLLSSASLWKKENRDYVNQKQRERHALLKRAMDPESLAYAEKVLIHDPCAYCGATPGIATKDHIVPVSKGGETSWENLTASCQTCNLMKSDLDLLPALLKIQGRLATNRKGA